MPQGVTCPPHHVQDLPGIIDNDEGMPSCRCVCSSPCRADLRKTGTRLFVSGAEPCCRPSAACDVWSCHPPERPSATRALLGVLTISIRRHQASPKRSTVASGTPPRLRTVCFGQHVSCGVRYSVRHRGKFREGATCHRATLLSLQSVEPDGHMLLTKQLRPTSPLPLLV